MGQRPGWRALTFPLVPERTRVGAKGRHSSPGAQVRVCSGHVCPKGRCLLRRRFPLLKKTSCIAGSNREPPGPMCLQRCERGSIGGLCNRLGSTRRPRTGRRVLHRCGPSHRLTGGFMRGFAAGAFSAAFASRRPPDIDSPFVLRFDGFTANSGGDRRVHCRSASGCV